MIGYFPSPYEDELLYSICARYSEQVKYPSAKAFCLDLFGSENVSAIVDLPGCLQYLAKVLPPNDSYSLEKLIENHTLLPFYRPFFDPQKADQIVNQMISSKACGVYMRAGLAASRVNSVRYLRYCPLCVSIDNSNYGETYWRRTHQLSSVIVCTKHLVYLEQSQIKIYGSPRQHQFYSATENIPANIPARCLGESKKDFLVLKLAQFSSKLLSTKIPAIGKTVLTGKYLKILVERGLASYSLSLRATELETEFLKFYTSEFLSEFGCQLTKIGDSTNGNWLFNMLRKYPKGSHHPFHHLILMIFLEIDVTNFFDLDPNVNFFGEGPWCCLNPAASHYKEFVVTDFRLGSRCRKGKPVGIFKCGCGFEFARSGPDQALADKFRIDKMMRFGSIWEAKLKKLWNDPTFNLSEIARQLKVDPLTVRRYAEKLQLSFERGTKSYLELRKKDKLIIETGSSAKSEQNKTKWRLLLKENPEILLKELRLQNPRLYSWLQTNIPEWLKINLPTKSSLKKFISSSINWEERDSSVVISVQNAAHSIRKKSGRPKQITKTAIGKEADCLSFLLTKIDKLPNTAKALESIIETKEEYGVRKIRWATKFLKENGLPVNYWNIIEKACVYKLRKHPLIDRILIEVIHGSKDIDEHH